MIEKPEVNASKIPDPPLPDSPSWIRVNQHEFNLPESAGNRYFFYLKIGESIYLVENIHILYGAQDSSRRFQQYRTGLRLTPISNNGEPLQEKRPIIKFSAKLLEDHDLDYHGTLKIDLIGGGSRNGRISSNIYNRLHPFNPRVSLPGVGSADPNNLLCQIIVSPNGLSLNIPQPDQIPVRICDFRTSDLHAKLIK